MKRFRFRRIRTSFFLLALLILLEAPLLVYFVNSLYQGTTDPHEVPFVTIPKKSFSAANTQVYPGIRFLDDLKRHLVIAKTRNQNVTIEVLNGQFTKRYSQEYSFSKGSTPVLAPSWFDMDNDRQEEILFTERVSDSVGVIGMLDYNDGKVILDSVNFADFMSIIQRPKFTIKPVTTMYYAHSLESFAWAFASVEISAGGEVQRFLALLKKTPVPHLERMIPTQHYVNYGVSYIGVDGGQHYVLGSYFDGAKVTNEASHANAVIQLDDSGKIEWTIPLEYEPTRTFITETSDEEFLLAVSTHENSFTLDDSISIKKIYKHSGKVIQDSICDGHFHPFNGVDALYSNYIGYVQDSNTDLYLLDNNGYLSKKINKRIHNITYSYSSVFPLPNNEFVFSIAKDNMYQVLLNVHGKQKGLIPASVLKYPVKLDWEGKSISYAFSESDGYYTIHHFQANPFGLWWLWRFRNILSLFVVPFLVLFGVYFLRYQQLRQRSKAVLIRAYRRMRSRWLQRTRELVATNKRLKEEVEMRKQLQSTQLQNEARMQNLLENLADGYFEFNLKTGEYYGYDRSNSSLSPLESRKHQIQSWREHIHPEDVSEMEKTFMEHNEGKLEQVTGYVRVLDKRTNEWFPVFHRCKITRRDDSGAPAMVVGSHVRIPMDVFRGCGQNKKNVLETVIDSLSEGLITINTEETITRCNLAAGKLLGIQVQNAIGKTIGEYLPLLDIPHLARAHQGKMNQEIELSFFDQKGDRKTVRVRFVRLHSKLPDESAEVLLIITDYTMSMKLEVFDDQNAVSDRIIGRSAQMAEVFHLIESVSDSLATVLIFGESGTGKEMVADQVHKKGLRKDGPFIRVNCAAIAEQLLESEMFGHVKGAFTGAYRDRVGRFEAAQDGTIFLDEIGDLSPALQTKLLRVLQEGEYERVGENKTRKTNARIIAATNADLQKKIASGEFREDLYFRLNVFTITVPPLRERYSDIPLLADHFRRKYSITLRKQVISINEEVLDILMSYQWPGNIRELENCIQRAIVVCRDAVIQSHHLPKNIVASVQNAQSETKSDNARVRFVSAQTKTTKRIALTSEMIEDVLRKTNWNVSAAAKELDISRNSLYLKMKKFNIVRPR